jgi:hypothetical protein
VAVEDIVPDTSALIAYAENDLRALPVDELLEELREDSGGQVILGWFVLEDAQRVLRADRTALGRLEVLASEHGVRFADADMQQAIGLIVAEGQVSRGLAHAMLLTAAAGCSLATYAAPTLEKAGFAMSRVLDLDEFFRAS